MRCAAIASSAEPKMLEGLDREVTFFRTDNMTLTRLHLANVGQIREATLEFGDLTVFVGPQATGKSIALQMLKLLVDSGTIHPG